MFMTFFEIRNVQHFLSNTIFSSLLKFQEGIQTQTQPWHAFGDNRFSFSNKKKTNFHKKLSFISILNNS